MLKFFRFLVGNSASIWLQVKMSSKVVATDTERFSNGITFIIIVFLLSLTGTDHIQYLWVMDSYARCLLL